MKNDITIIIPTFNGENYIAKTIESCLNLNYVNFNVIIIDDKSTDKTVEISKRYVSNRLRVLENTKNIGLSRNVNKAVLSIKSEYFILLGQDDLLDPEHLNILIDEVDENTVLVHCNSYIINKDDTIIGVSRDDSSQILKTNNVYHELSIDNFISSTGLLQKTAAFNEVGGWDNSHMHYGEWLYYIKVLELGNIKYTHRVKSYYRRHEANLSKSFNKIRGNKELFEYKKQCRSLARQKSKKNIKNTCDYFYKNVVRVLRDIKNGY